MHNPTPSDRRNVPQTPFRVPRVLREPSDERPEEQVERALLVSVLLPNTRADLQDPLGELHALAESARIQVVDKMIQKRTALGAAYALGKGKLAELAERAIECDADVIVFDNDLSPRQIRGLEDAAGRKVIDRTELILDIFAGHARTHAAKLQVELAQLQYTAPRLRGLWTHLERIAGVGGATAAGAVGGVGTRGPGERQLEMDRRNVEKRIGFLQRQIEDIDRRKRREVHSRRDQFTVSLVGYTNSGKSTLMNRLTDAGQLTADMLFATLDTKTVRWDLGEGRSVLLSDTVGFIRDLPHLLVASFRATLEEAVNAHLLLHVADGSSPTAFRQIEAVDAVLADLGCTGMPQILVLNKCDLAADQSLTDLLAHRRARILRVSALTGEGLDELTEVVREAYLGDTAEVTVRLPHREGRLIAELDRLADVRRREFTADAVQLEIRMNRTQLRQLLGRHPNLELIHGDVDPEDLPPLGESA